MRVISKLIRIVRERSSILFRGCRKNEFQEGLAVKRGNQAVTKVSETACSLESG
jgi:hypothetical protein